MSIQKIHDLDVVKLKTGKVGTIQFVHDENINPQGYEFQDESTDELITITDNDIEKVIDKYVWANNLL